MGQEAGVKKKFYHWQIIITPCFLNINDSDMLFNIELLFVCFLFSIFPSFSFIFSFFILRNTTSVSFRGRSSLWSFDCEIVLEFLSRSHFELEGRFFSSKFFAQLGVFWCKSRLKNLFSKFTELTFEVLSAINLLD